MPQTIRAPLPVLLAGAAILVGCRPPPGATEVEELLHRREFKGAEATLQRELARHPRSDALWSLRLRLHVVQGQRREAVEAYRQRSRSHGESSALLHTLSLAVIRSALESRVPELRLAAVQVARETDANELEGEVAARLADPDPVVRTWAAVALSGRRDGVDVLDEQLRASDPRAREIAVRELARLAGAAALESLVRASTDRHAAVRAAAAAGLGLVKRPEAVGAVRRLLGDPDGAVRAEAARAASALGAAALGADLRRLTTDSSLPARLAAVSALAAVGDGEARSALKAIASSPDAFAALRAGLQLARLGDLQPALDAVARGLVDRSWAVRAASCTTASQLHDRVGVQLVERALRDPEPRVRLAAARAVLAGLAELRDVVVKTARAVQRLGCGDGTRPPASEICLEASDLLVRAGEPNGMPMLKQVARSATTPEQRLSALRGALLLAPDRQLALDGVADTDARIALTAASWLYRRAH